MVAHTSKLDKTLDSKLSQYENFQPLALPPIHATLRVPVDRLLPKKSRSGARSPSFRIPDAGKTTLTEKLLLYGGAVQLAGSVTARKNQRATTSDWMELEKQARHFHQLHRAAIRLRRLSHQPARHARPQGFFRGHLSRADGRGFGGDGD